MTQVWQIAAGIRSRDYTDLFLKHDVMFMGPGARGDYNTKRDAYITESRANNSQIKSFTTDVKTGDIVLLRFCHRVVAIGKISEEGYKWNDVFDDVFGWDLQHTHRVIWQEHLTEKLREIQKDQELFGERKQQPTFTAVRDRRVLDRIEHLFTDCETRPLRTMPEKLPDPLTLDELGAELFSKGLPNEAVDKLIVAIQRQRRLVKWYEKYGKSSMRPTEHEVVAHMILPFLLALGWSEQLLAVEWYRIDLAAFSRIPTTKESLCLLCEAKGLGHGLQNTFEQATEYVDKHKLDNCKRILLTDGARLYLYQRKRDNSWNENPAGYFNVNLIRTSHLIPYGTNGIDTIMALTPAGITREVGK